MCSCCCQILPLYRNKVVLSFLSFNVVNILKYCLRCLNSVSSVKKFHNKLPSENCDFLIKINLLRPAWQRFTLRYILIHSISWCTCTMLSLDNHQRWFALSFIYYHLFASVESITGFEPCISDVESDCSTNWAKLPKVVNFIWHFNGRATTSVS